MCLRRQRNRYLSVCSRYDYDLIHGFSSHTTPVLPHADSSVDWIILQIAVYIQKCSRCGGLRHLLSYFEMELRSYVLLGRHCCAWIRRLLPFLTTLHPWFDLLFLSGVLLPFFSGFDGSYWFWCGCKKPACSGHLGSVMLTSLLEYLVILLCWGSKLGFFVVDDLSYRMAYRSPERSS